jgi:hypothetical protein
LANVRRVAAQDVRLIQCRDEERFGGALLIFAQVEGFDSHQDGEKRVQRA